MTWNALLHRPAVFLRYSSSGRAPAADAQESTAACSIIVLTLIWKFPRAPPGAPTSTTTRETSIRERGNCGREMTGNFAYNGEFHVIVGIFYMPKICDTGPTALLPLRRIFSSWKIRRLRPGSNPQTWVVRRLYSRQKGIWHPDETRKIGMTACLGAVVKKKVWPWRELKAKVT
jgi:hypothetical protein